MPGPRRKAPNPDPRTPNPISAFPSTIPVRLDGEGRIASDVACPHCGYNLRMQRAAGDCPECGHAIDVSDALPADHLDRADPRWRQRLARGSRWLFWGVAILPLGGVPGLVLAAAGLWLLTTKEPERDETWFHRGTRLSARFANAAAAVGAVALAVLLLRFDVSLSPGRLLAQDFQWFDLLLSTVGACIAVGMLEAWRHLFRLAARADGPNVAQACRRAWKRYLLGVAVLVVLSAGVTVADRLDIRWVAAYYQYFAGAALLVVLITVGGLWWTTVSLTRRLRDVLRDTPTGSFSV